jgi:uncharacterized protein
MKYFKELSEIIIKDTFIIRILKSVRCLPENKFWVAAGCIRNRVWDYLHDYEKNTPLNDVDVIYYDNTDLSEDSEKRIESLLSSYLPDIPWSVKNQARMHTIANCLQYKSIDDAMRGWPETATAVALRLTDNSNIDIIAPYGLDDLFHLMVKPTPCSKDKTNVFRERMRSKAWLENWPKLKVIC